MNTHQGFSLTEVLISLFLITSTSLGLLTQQWQAARLTNQAKFDSITVIERDNTAERLLAGYQASESKLSLFLANNSG